MDPSLIEDLACPCDFTDSTKPEETAEASGCCRAQAEVSEGNLEDSDSSLRSVLFLEALQPSYDNLRDVENEGKPENKQHGKNTSDKPVSEGKKSMKVRGRGKKGQVVEKVEMLDWISPTYCSIAESDGSQTRSDSVAAPGS
ncbi:hypothetical protein K438DRAFT_1771291 [Mycena galopus ATCC 62051]|nr:hypothetical protein K438DRAFT_1771291 [Mycena galopus ATCC 62051]